MEFPSLSANSLIYRYNCQRYAIILTQLLELSLLCVFKATTTHRYVTGDIVWST